MQTRITDLQEKKAALFAPKPPPKKRKTKKQKMEDVLKLAQKAGMGPEEIAEKLGIVIEK